MVVLIIVVVFVIFDEYVFDFFIVIMKINKLDILIIEFKVIFKSKLVICIYINKIIIILVIKLIIFFEINR